MDCGKCKWSGCERVCRLCRTSTVEHALASLTREHTPSKFNAVICEADRLKFPSKKHRAFYLRLRAEQQAGAIKFFLREVPFDLPGQYDNGRVVRHYVDFAVIHNDGTVSWHEVKGRDLPMGKLKRAQVEELYGIKVIIE
ncbi:MAG: DUF1064 domain-containing protein [Candidatus Binatia bacterium]|nr:DUF1064 domain-containing protein [Candidatus Binatia bacterium]